MDVTGFQKHRSTKTHKIFLIKIEYLFGCIVVCRYRQLRLAIILLLICQHFSTLDEFITSLKVQRVQMQINVCMKGVEETESTNNECNTFKA